MKRSFLSLSVLVALFVLCGCSRFFIQKDAYNSVKKAALVQYVINPHMMLGTPSSDEVRVAVADRNVATFLKEMNGKPYELVPQAELVAKPEYIAAGKDAVDGYYTGKGMRFITTDTSALQGATLTPEEAKGLCEKLGVDAVVAMFDSWGQEAASFGLAARTKNTYYVNMYDKNGVKVWGDVVGGTAEDTVAAPGGIIAAEVEPMVANFNQAFTAGMKEMSQHLAK